ncbi:phosphoglycerate dehydrogenase-like enzyme [Stackebrandtia albiflava]|uniref:Phosphoglycerate dehydrogenase-like enzyme n=1 Tax=Stackebrandtia albiflava TaxID=406432 RepID=A0A562UYQ1_9ACTN|nr:hydroxyacid dehydrogenase [Stackebrandtia albiflava]TWJ10727.1 phosphoglycerate dehydrogenase-like enzyme [Stackebrandtia albiflava]
MSQRPYGVLAMSRYARETAFPAPVLHRLDGHAEVPGTVLIDDFAAADVREHLERAEILVTGWGCPPITADVLDAAPRLRLVAHAAGSVKHHVTPAVWERGIAVSSAADANAEPVAEYTRAMILLGLKGALRHAAEYPALGWPGEARRGDCGYVGRVVGVVGASRIGRRVMALLRDWDTTLLVSDPYLTPDEAVALGARLVDLDELCATSDLVSVHAPELPETRHLLDDRRLAMMRDGAVLVNTARGSIVDTEALVRHCVSGRLSAVLDVTEPEPLPADHPLLHLPNVTVTPHVAGAQGTEIALLGDYAVAEIARFLAGEPLRGEVTAADLPRLA